MIYDCGVLRGAKKIDHQISEYTKNLGNSKIDMLVASHLHQDHVCGFETLMNGVGVRYVFLPYLLPIQRLLLALSESQYADQSYYDFIADPVSYLFERGVEKIILVGNCENNEYRGREIPNYDGSDDDLNINSEDLNDKSIQMPDDNDLRKVITKNDPQLLERYRNRLSIKSHQGIVSLRQKWNFRFFNPPTKGNLKLFEKCVTDILSGEAKLDNATLRTILADITHLDKLADCY